MTKERKLADRFPANLYKGHRKDDVLRKLFDLWNSKNAQAGKRVGTFGFMAAALSACKGGGDGSENLEGTWFFLLSRGGDGIEAKPFSVDGLSSQDGIIADRNSDFSSILDDG